MINLESLKRVVRAHVVNVLHQRTSEAQVLSAIEYAVSKAVARRRNVWSDVLSVSASDFFEALRYYYKYQPQVVSDYTASYTSRLRAPRPGRYLRVEFC